MIQQDITKDINFARSELKKDGSLLTKYDLLVEEKIFEILKDSNADIVTEEVLGKNENKDFCWYVDPIDGTTSFSRGTGTDHGSGGVAFLLGKSVEGGLYGDYPNLEPSAQLEGDIHYNTDFRSLYSTILEDVLGVEASSVLNEKFNKLDIVKN